MRKGGRVSVIFSGGVGACSSAPLILSIETGRSKDCVCPAAAGGWSGWLAAAWSCAEDGVPCCAHEGEATSVAVTSRDIRRIELGRERPALSRPDPRLPLLQKSRHRDDGRSHSNRCAAPRRGRRICPERTVMHQVPREDQLELANAIAEGAKRRPSQAFGEYFDDHGGSCALGAAYEGAYALPEDAHAIRPRPDRIFDCTENG